MNAKPWYQSKTLWVNVGVLLAVAFGGDHVRSWGLSPESTAAIMATANIFLRWLTMRPLGLL